MKKDFFHLPFVSCLLQNAPENYASPDTLDPVSCLWLPEADLETFFSSENLDYSFSKPPYQRSLKWDGSVDRTASKMPSFFLLESFEKDCFLIKVKEGKVVEKIFLTNLRVFFFEIVETPELIYVEYLNFNSGASAIKAFQAESLKETVVDAEKAERISRVLREKSGFFRDGTRSPETFVYINFDESKIRRVDSDFSLLYEKNLRKISPESTKSGRIMKIDGAGRVYISFDHWIVILDPDFERKLEIYLPNFCYQSGKKRHMKNGDLLERKRRLVKREIFHYNLAGGDIHVKFHLEDPELEQESFASEYRRRGREKQKRWPGEDEKAPFDVVNHFLLKTVYHAEEEGRISATCFPPEGRAPDQREELPLPERRGKERKGDPPEQRAGGPRPKRATSRGRKKPRGGKRRQ